MRASLKSWFIASLVPALLTGCGGELTSEEGSATDAVGSSEQAISGLEHSWYAGWAFAKMGLSTDRACFLNMMTGHFNGASEHIATTVHSGVWNLGGAALHAGVGAKGRCMAVRGGAYFSEESSWEQGQLFDTNLGSSSGRACFFTRISGKFEGASESVEIYEFLGAWYLGGSSSQRDVAASARCVSVQSVSQEYAWKQGEPPLNLGPTLNRDCFLTAVAGDFEGRAESVRVYEDGKGSWFLHGASARSGVSARARCVTPY
jgi:hypothetical protein